MSININTNILHYILSIINYDIVNETTHIEKTSDSFKVLKKRGGKVVRK